MSQSITELTSRQSRGVMVSTLNFETRSDPSSSEILLQPHKNLCNSCTCVMTYSTYLVILESSKYKLWGKKLNLGCLSKLISVNQQKQLSSNLNNNNQNNFLSV